jgi:hypothetical protein
MDYAVNVASYYCNSGERAMSIALPKQQCLTMEVEAVLVDPDRRPHSDNNVQLQSQDQALRVSSFRHLS